MSDFSIFEPTGRSIQKPTDSRYSAPALEKGLDIIELLATGGDRLSMGGIAERLGRSRGEIFRMVNVLEARGYIERDDRNDTFAVTNRLFELGMRHPPVRSLVEVALPIMADLAHHLGQSCHLTVVSFQHNVVIARCESPGAESFSVSLGYRRNLADSTSGRVLLAFQPPKRRHQLLEPVRQDPPSGLDEAQLLADLEAIQARGYEIAGSRTIVGITDIGAPILDALGTAIACLTVPFINRVDRRNDLPAAAEHVVAAADAIGERLAGATAP